MSALLCSVLDYHKQQDETVSAARLLREICCYLLFGLGAACPIPQCFSGSCQKE